jgi:hypothetical protein
MEIKLFDFYLIGTAEKGQRAPQWDPNDAVAPPEPSLSSADHIASPNHRNRRQNDRQTLLKTMKGVRYCSSRQPVSVVYM